MKRITLSIDHPQMLSIELELYLIQNILSKLKYLFQKCIIQWPTTCVFKYVVLIMKLVLYKWLFLILQEVSLMHFDFVIILSVSIHHPFDCLSKLNNSTCMYKVK